MTGLILVLSMQAGMAYELDGSQVWMSGGTCPSGITWDNSSVGFYVFDTLGPFTAAERVGMILGIQAWDSGPGTVNRGADFDYVFLGYTSDTGSIVDTKNHVWHITQAQGQADYALGRWGAWGPSFTDGLCTKILYMDIVYANDVAWTSGLPSSSTALSTEAVGAHEAGHTLGLDHEEDVVGVMYRNQFAENGSEIRLGEDDYAAIRYLFPLNSNTGKNFMLTKFRETGTQDDRPWDERWDLADANATWTDGICGTVTSGGPARVYASVNGTAPTYYDVPVEWTLSVDQVCFNGDDITIGTRTPDLTSNASPYKVGPAGDAYFIPSSTPDGDYYVCAGINPDQTLSEAESSYDDNIIISEATWTIDCP